MGPEDLRSFLHMLEQADQLARISVAVDAHLELATIVDLVSKGAGRGQGLLFERVRGAGVPVAANLFGSPERMSWAIGTTDLADKAEQLAVELSATGEIDGGRALHKVCARQNLQPLIVSNPEFRSKDCSAAGLRVIPPIRAWPGDGGSFLTLPQVYTRHPDRGAGNCGMYRIQCLDSHIATVRCRPGSGAADHLRAWHERGQAMPVAIALGGPPILSWAAAAPFPAEIDEVAFCGYLQGCRMAMARCQTSELLVPATAEMVIEGVMEPGSVAAEGPFGNHTGSYDVEASAPVMKVLTVHTRHDAIYPWTLVGPPPMENVHLAQAAAVLFMPLLRMALPSLRQVYMPPEGIFHGAALVTVDPGEAHELKEIARLLWETPLLRRSRLLVIGADDHPPRDASAVFWRALNRVDWQRDLLIEGRQLAVDARRLSPGTQVARSLEITAKVLDRWREFRLEGTGR